MELEARPMVQVVSQWMYELGIKGIPRGPRPETKANPGGLTQREFEVLHLLAQGQREKQIARSLNLSERTVHHHVSTALGKLGTRSRAEVSRHFMISLGFESDLHLNMAIARDKSTSY